MQYIFLCTELVMFSNDLEENGERELKIQNYFDTGKLLLSGVNIYIF